MRMLKTKFVLGTALILALAACSQAFPTVQVSEPPADSQPAATDSPAEAAPPASTEAEAGAPPAEPPTQAAQPTGEPAAATPTEPTPLGSPELKASDPATVSLAAGKVQLVEFFAFW